MRPHDKKKNIQRANILAEQRHLIENSLMGEAAPMIRDGDTVLELVGSYTDERIDFVEEIIEYWHKKGVAAKAIKQGNRNHIYVEAGARDRN